MGRWGRLSRWWTWLSVLVVLLDIALVFAAFIWHSEAGMAILVLSLALLGWRLRRDHLQSRWQRQGGYEVLESCVWLRFADASASRTEVRKKQVLLAHVPGIHEVIDSHVRSDGRVEDPRVRPGRIIDRKRVGVGWRYLIDLEKELPVGKPFERWIEVVFIDSYPDKERETHIIHIKRPTRRVEAIIEFHPDLKPD